MLTLAPSASSATTNKPTRGDQIVFKASTDTFRQPLPALSVRRWAFAQRLSDAAKLATLEPGADEDDEYLVEPPDSSIWENLPVSSWG